MPRETVFLGGSSLGPLKRPLKPYVGLSCPRFFFYSQQSLLMRIVQVCLCSHCSSGSAELENITTSLAGDNRNPEIIDRKCEEVHSEGVVFL